MNWFGRWGNFATWGKYWIDYDDYVNNMYDWGKYFDTYMRILILEDK